MKADYVHKDTLTATDYVELNKNNELLMSYNQALIKENRELKKQLEEYKKELEKADSITQSCIFNGKKESEISFRQCLNMLEEYKQEKQEWINLLDMFKNQQKEFIEYMNETIEELECDDVGDEELKGYLLQRIDTFKEILSKYKKIIGDNK